VCNVKGGSLLDMTREDRLTEKAKMVTLHLEKIRECMRAEDYATLKKLHYNVGVLYEKMSYVSQAIYHYLSALYFGINVAKSEEKGDDLEFQIIAGIKRNAHSYDDEMTDYIYRRNQNKTNIFDVDKFKRLVAEYIAL
jgi:hypothetical protein